MKTCAIGIPGEMTAATARTATLSISERLQRWATVLEAREDALSLLSETEFVPEPARSHLREDLSPIAVAFADPALRRQGLAGDTYGDARDFFGLSHRSLHYIACYCFYRSSRVPAPDIARRVREAARRAERVERVLSVLGLRGPRAGALVRLWV